jgi:16S rRNA (cytosine967-C5)-methyltransferase
MRKRSRSHGRPAATPTRGHGRRSTRGRDDRVSAREAAQAQVAFAHVMALEVVREAYASDVPADRLLKARLRDSHFEPGTGALAARLVFSWFRWCGFLPGAEPSPETLLHTLELADRYAKQPGRFGAQALIEGAVPGWLRQHMEVPEDFVRALQREPALWLRARPGQARELAAQLPLGVQRDAHAGLPDALRYTGTEDLFRSAPFNQGRFEIQDIASQAVGVVCDPRPGETWWDACAGEGGKTLHLADLMHNRGLLWASDRSDARLAVLRRRAARAGIFNYRAVAWDGGARPPTRTHFDGVLVDAPCSGVGTWQRNPHARWTTSPVDVSELATIQQRLLDTAAGSIKPGGRLIYAVCTLTRDETTAVAAAFAATHPDFEPAPFADPFAPGGAPVAQATWMPQLTGGNGMFVAAWRRVSR